MKRFAFIALVCLFAALEVRAQVAQVTVSGNLKDAGIANVTGNNTYVRFTLTGFGGNIPRVTGTNVIAVPYKDFKPDAGGNISGAIQGNDTITIGGNAQPGGTWYQMCIVYQGQQFRCAPYTINGATFNLNSAIPNSTTPVVAAPTGDNTYFRKDGANGPITGPLNLSNQATPPGTASAGTVNVYTKAADKGLYYKNDAGVETGPLSTAGAATITSPVTVPNPLNFDTDLGFKGPNPYLDVTRYGVRAVNPNVTPASGGLTGNCASGSPVISNLSSASSFINGDGFVAYGCGPAHTLTAPVGVTVTPSVASDLAGTGHVVNGPAGSTTYNYQVFACTKNGGCTAASSVATTTTGAATLGVNSVALTSCSRTNAVVTCVTSAAHGIPVGGLINIVATTDNSQFGGWFIVDTVADTTHFTFTSGLDTRNGTVNNSATGGTVYWWNANHIAWTAVANAWLYGIFRGSTLVGMSRPQTALVTDATFDDFGSTMTSGTIFPPHFPTTVPAAATNESLVSTIVSGAGTTTLTLANNAGATVTGAGVRFDDGPTVLAAANAARTQGANLRFPVTSVASGQYVINSYTVLPILTSISGGGVYLNETLEFGTNNVWDGLQLPFQYSVPTFALRGGAPITVNAAYPGLIGAPSLVLQGLNISVLSANGGLGVFTENAMDLTFVNFNTAAADQTSLNFLARGLDTSAPFPFRFRHCSSTGGPASQANGITSAPLMYFNKTGAPVFEDFFVSRRGVSLFPASGAFETVINNGRMQGGDQPLLSLYYTGGTFGGPIAIGPYELDTQPNAIFANLSTAATSFIGPVFLQLDNTVSTDTGTNPGLVTGRALGRVTALGLATSSLGQNVNSIIEGSNFTDRAVRIVGAGKYVFDLPVPAAPTSCVVSAGGSETVATHTYAISWLSGNFTPYQTTLVGPTCSATTTSGNQTVTITPPTAPSGAVGYLVWRDGSLANISGCLTFGKVALGTNYVANVGFGCGNSQPASSAAGSSVLDQSGVATKLIQSQRNLMYGTPLVAGDIALGAGWGNTAAVSAVTGTDQAFNFTITTGGTGIAANPTFTVTFHDGTWTNAPIGTCIQSGGNDIFANTTLTNGVTTATTVPATWNGTPTTAKTYIFTCGPFSGR